MAEDIRNRNRGPQQSSQASEPRHQNDRQLTQDAGDQESQPTTPELASRSSTDRSRSSHDARSVANDRGLAVDRARRSFSGDREADELGSEVDDATSVEDGDDEFEGSGSRGDRSHYEG